MRLTSRKVQGQLKKEAELSGQSTQCTEQNCYYILEKSEQAFMKFASTFFSQATLLI